MHSLEHATDGLDQQSQQIIHILEGHICQHDPYQQVREYRADFSSWLNNFIYGVVMMNKWLLDALTFMLNMKKDFILNNNFNYLKDCYLILL